MPLHCHISSGLLLRLMRLLLICAFQLVTGEEGQGHSRSYFDYYEDYYPPAVIPLPPLKIDTTKNDDNSKDACKRLLTGGTFILSIGRLISTSAILLTSDLFLYELVDENLDEKTQPPYRILINNQKPKHLRTRFPTSYPALVNITDRIISSYTMALQTADGTADQEYIVFHYNKDNSYNTCIFAIDIRLDQPAYGPCGLLIEYISKGISVLPCRKLAAEFIKSNGSEQLTCPGNNLLELYRNWTDPTTSELCTKLDGCPICQSWIPPNGADGRPDFESSNFCRQIPDGSTIQSGYFPVLNKMYLFDDQQSVCIMENSLISLDLVRRPLTEFLGCDVELLMSFQLQKTTIFLIIAIAIIGQIVLCVGGYCVFKNLIVTPDETKLDKGKRKNRKSRKKKRKRIKSTASKSRAELASRRSTQSRLSLGSVSVSKRRSSQLSRSSKSRLSRRNSRQQTSVAPTDTAPISFGPSISQQHDASRISN